MKAYMQKLKVEPGYAESLRQILTENKLRVDTGGPLEAQQYEMARALAGCFASDLLDDYKTLRDEIKRLEGERK